MLFPNLHNNRAIIKRKHINLCLYTFLHGVFPVNYRNLKKMAVRNKALFSLHILVSILFNYAIISLNPCSQEMNILQAFCFDHSSQKCFLFMYEGSFSFSFF